MNDPIVVTRTLVKRAWADVEPKLQWAFASGAAASFLLELAHAYGITLPPIVTQEAPYILAILAGYIMPSVGQTVTTIKDVPGGRVKETEAHTGTAVSVVTSPTPVQIPLPTKRATFTEVVDNAPAAQDEQPTQVIPGTTLPNLDQSGLTPAQRFMRHLPSQQTGPQDVDSH